MEACVGNNPSFIRRSICEGREVLRLGLRWCGWNNNYPFVQHIFRRWFDHLAFESRFYTVKSGYRVLFEFNRLTAAGGKLTMFCRVLYLKRTGKHLAMEGDMECQNHKVKLFALRACQNIIPTMENLQKRKLSTVATCLLFFRTLESFFSHSAWLQTSKRGLGSHRSGKNGNLVAQSASGCLGFIRKLR